MLQPPASPNLDFGDIAGHEATLQQFDAKPTYATLGTYSFGQKSAPSQLKATDHAMDEGQLLEQLLLDPPSPTTTAFDGLTAASDAQTTALSSLGSSGPGGLPSEVQDSTSPNLSSNWSDLLMPLLAACKSEASNSAPSSSLTDSSSSSSLSFSSSSTATTAGAYPESFSGVPIESAHSASFASGIPAASTASRTDPLAIGDHIAPPQVVATTKGEVQSGSLPTSTDPQNLSQASLNESGWPRVDNLASWLDQDVCTSTSHHPEPCCDHQKQQLSRSNVSSRQATRPSSPRPQSRPHSFAGSGSKSSGYALLPLMNPQGQVWGAVMMNGTTQAQAGGEIVESPISDYSTLTQEDEHQPLSPRTAQQGVVDGYVVEEAMDGAANAFHDDEVQGDADGAESPQSCPLSPEHGPLTFEPMAVFASAATGITRSASIPICLPANMLDLQQNILQGPAAFGSTNNPAPQQCRQHRSKSRTSTCASNSGAGFRKHKQDAVQASAVRSRRQSGTEQRQCQPRWTSLLSESKGESENNVTRALQQFQSQSGTVSQDASSQPPLRTSSFSTPSTANSVGAGSKRTINRSATTSACNNSGNGSISGSGSTASKTLGFTITDQIVLPPRPGSEDEEVSYPRATNSVSEMQNNPGPKIDTLQQAEKAVEQVQNLFPSDLYAPRFTRRGECGREGWCSLCPRGDWYSMKRSQYLYHMQFDHGISNLTRKFFHPPQQLRVWNDAVTKTDGLCHHCNKWIPICFGPQRKRDFKAWFKHARKCHRDDTGCPI